MADFSVVRRGSLEYEMCSRFPDGCIHGFTTRLGGVSQGHLASLNLGTGRGDDPANVRKNYQLLGQAMGFAPEQTVCTRQTHSDIVVRVGKENRGEGLLRPVGPERDGLVTNEPGVALTVFGADCTPVLLFDPVGRAIGACHAGWRGMAAGIPRKTVEKMAAEFGCRPENIHAAIGPCISRCCFETDRDVPEAMLEALGPEAEDALQQQGEKFRVDLKALAALWLRRAGLIHIYASPSCTACQTDRFWSHRRMGNARGLQGAVIMLK